MALRAIAIETARSVLGEPIPEMGPEVRLRNAGTRAALLRRSVVVAWRAVFERHARTVELTDFAHLRLAAIEDLNGT